MHRYFEAFDRIRDLKKLERYQEAFDVVVEACSDIPMSYGFNPGPPCEFLVDYAVVHQRDAELDAFLRYARQRRFEHLLEMYGPNWGAFLAEAERKRDQFSRVLDTLRRDDAVLQPDLLAQVGGDTVATVAKRALKEIERLRLRLPRVGGKRSLALGRLGRVGMWRGHSGDMIWNYGRPGAGWLPPTGDRRCCR